MIRRTAYVPSILALAFILLAGEGIGSSVRNSALPGASSNLAASANQGITAKAYILKVWGLARAWKVDAELYRVLNSEVGPDGKSSASPTSMWLYTFFSKKANRGFMVTVAGGGVSGFEIGKGGVTSLDEALPRGFMDSDQVMAAAKSAGFQPDPINSMSLWKSVGEPPAWMIGSFRLHGVTGRTVEKK